MLFIEPVCGQRGIRRMLDVLGVPDEDVAVFGDGTNDVCSVRAGLAFGGDGERLRGAERKGGLHYDIG